MYKLISIFFVSLSFTIATSDIYDNSWALVIGIDKYQNVQPLNYAVNDAETIKDILVNTFNFSENNVTLLTNENATKQRIIQAFSDITTRADKNDRVLIYFAGHGETMELPEGGELGYLLPVDGDSENLYVSSIAMAELKNISLMSKAKHLLYLVDACYGGIAAVGSRGLDDKTTPNYIDKITRNKSRQIITAGGKGEEVIEKTEWGHSAFTLNLKRGLQEGNADLNADGYITANELGIFLAEKVTIDSQDQQTPQYGRMTSQEGEFVFITNIEKDEFQDKKTINKDDIDYNLLAKEIAKELENNKAVKSSENSTTPTISLIHFTSFPEHISEYDDDDGLEIVDNHFLDDLREHFEIQLMTWYFGQQKNFIIPVDKEQIDYFDSHPLLSIHLDLINNERITLWFDAAHALYKKFNQPERIIYFNIYQDESQYHFSISKCIGDPGRGNNGNWHFKVDKNGEIFDKVGKNLRNLLGESRQIGVISKIEDDMIFIKLNDLNVRKSMEIIGSSTYYFGPGNDGYVNMLEDLKNGIEYMTIHSDEEFEDKLEQYQNNYSALLADSLYCIGGCIQTRDRIYKLRVKTVIDSVAITELIGLDYPWVKIRPKDHAHIIPHQ